MIEKGNIPGKQEEREELRENEERKARGIFLEKSQVLQASRVSMPLKVRSTSTLQLVIL